MGVNRVFLLGNLGADPEIRYTPSQMAVCNMRLATTERRRNQEGEWVDHTEWHSVVVWGKSAENCSQYLSKGRQVFIEGRLQTRKWQDQDGKDRYKTEIIASSVQFVGQKGEGVSSERGYAAGQSSQGMQTGGGSSGGASSGGSDFLENAPPISFDDDDIPF
jgi:single-strand DNA-binding protein